MSRCHTGTTYDAASRVTSETDALDGVTTYTYDAAGNRLTATNPEGTTRNSYDAQNRLTRLTTTDAADQIVADYAYNLDATGRRT
ncbi:RHS repeat domain-containing protein [Marinobacter sp.]|uniref:RHS repeat domain-containing protein n=1 Tax=Marinobacter sp. TaxID=50741 RepID=UPI0034A3064B